MTFEHLNGLIAAPFAPLGQDGKLDVTKIPGYYAFLKSNGIKGAFINGSTGEGVSLTVEEKKQVLEAWTASAKGDPDFKVIPLVGGTSLYECIGLAKHARDNGAYSIAMTSPFYFKPSGVDMLAKSCIMVAEQVPEIPFYYYHIPALTGVNYPMFELLSLLDGKLPNLAGIKYTHPDFMDFLACLRYKDGYYDMLWGLDEEMLPALSLGAKASVGSTFNYAAPLYHRLMAAFDKGDLATARTLQQQSIDMIRLLGKYGGIATGKAYMKLVGVDLGEFRLPVRNMNDAQFALFAQDVEGIGFSEYKSVL